MFTYVKLKNYRSLDNVVFDLKETKAKVKRLVAVYGENGCGKTNLLKSFYFLRMLLDSFTGVEFEEEFNDAAFEDFDEDELITAIEIGDE